MRSERRHMERRIRQTVRARGREIGSEIMTKEQN